MAFICNWYSVVRAKKNVCGLHDLHSLWPSATPE